MDNKVSKRDWEMISAYLDGQLAKKKLVRFEDRLSREASLQNALDEIRNTRQVLRNSPRLRAPRNFLLTPQMVGQRRQLPRLAPVFGWASAVASLLFVVIMVGDFFNPGGTVPVNGENELPPPAVLSMEISEESTTLQNDAGAIAFGVPVEADVGTARSEIPAGEAALEVAAAPEMEAVPAEAPPEIAEAPVEAAAPKEGPTPEPEISAAAEIPAAEVGVTAVETITDTARSDQSEELLSAMTVLTPTLTATFLVQEGGHHLEITATEVVAAENLEQEASQDLQSAEPISEMTVQDPATLQQSKVAAPDSQSTYQEPQTPAGSAAESDQGAVMLEEPAQEPISANKTSQIWMGLELALLLLALGTGIAWVYLHHRGG